MGSTAFEKLETRGTLTKTKRFRPGEKAEEGAHLVKLPKGAKPVNVSLSPREQIAWRTFGKFVQSREHENQELEDNLLKAHIRLRPEEYMAVAWMNTTIAAVAAVVAAFVAVLLLSFLHVDILYLLIIFALVAAVSVFLSYIIYFLLPLGAQGEPAP